MWRESRIDTEELGRVRGRVDKRYSFQRRRGRQGRKRENCTSERPLCHDSSTSAKDVGAAIVEKVRSDKMVMKRSNRDVFIEFILDLNREARNGLRSKETKHRKSLIVLGDIEWVDNQRTTNSSHQGKEKTE